MMQSQTHQVTGVKHASKAIIIYDSKPVKERQLWERPKGAASLITVHDIKNTPTGPVILEAKPVNQEGLEAMFEELFQSRRPPLEVLDPHLIAVTNNTVVWWAPKQSKLIRFKEQHIGKRQAVLEQPPLLFMIHNGDWYVFALEKNERPNASSKLLRSPYFNVWNSHKICVGTTKLPTSYEAFKPDRWTNAFFQSAFTHTNYHEGVVKYKRAATASTALPHASAFWIDMLDGKFKHFPMKVLKPTNLTLGSLLRNIEKGSFHESD